MERHKDLNSGRHEWFRRTRRAKLKAPSLLPKCQCSRRRVYYFAVSDARLQPTFGRPRIRIQIEIALTKAALSKRSYMLEFGQMGRATGTSSGIGYRQLWLAVGSVGPTKSEVSMVCNLCQRK